ncbi:hypothetical protein [Actinoplanes sp. NPDC049265]|uniref:hypothetical protein n=1 Tax=Actinoplanes sp. NPDC049265 TaxID=3363902 RepID=UPI00371DAE65
MRIDVFLLALAFLGGIAIVVYVTRHRLLKIGAHSLAAARKRAFYSRLRHFRNLVAEAAARPRAAKVDEPVPVVRSHHVLSNRLMDLPTRRLWPSTRHRVPPWVTSHDISED